MRSLRGLAFVALVGLTLAACQPAPTTTSVATPDVQSPVDGVVVAVDAASLTDVRGFTLRTSGGFSFVFKLGPLENATEFSPSHLKEHQATSSPVRAWFRVENGERVVYRIEDVVTDGPHATPAPVPPSPVVGIVTFIDSNAITEVQGFNLRLADGTVVHLEMGVLRNEAEFPYSQLSEHLSSGKPVRAYYERIGGLPYVYRLEDAST